MKSFTPVFRKKISLVILVFIFSCTHNSPVKEKIDPAVEVETPFREFLETGPCSNLKLKKREIELLKLKFDDNLLFYRSYYKPYEHTGSCQFCNERGIAYYYIQLKNNLIQIAKLKEKADKVRQYERLKEYENLPLMPECKSYWSDLDTVYDAINKDFDPVKLEPIKCGIQCDEEKLRQCAKSAPKPDLSRDEFENLNLDRECIKTTPTTPTKK